VSPTCGGADDAGMTTVEHNKRTVSDFIEALFSQGDLEAIDRYTTPDFVFHDPPFGVSEDRDGIRAAASMMRAGFPDWRSDQHLVVGEGDIVVEQFTASGTHQGEVMGVAPTGRTVSLGGINIFRLEEGRIAERWGRLDELGMLGQLGVIDQP
jgi:steroid delta-isomerase-like uncharacterized protein